MTRWLQHTWPRESSKRSCVKYRRYDVNSTLTAGIGDRWGDHLLSVGGQFARTSFEGTDIGLPVLVGRAAGTPLDGSSSSALHLSALAIPKSPHSWTTSGRQNLIFNPRDVQNNVSSTKIP
jgi:hypothetical protein